MKKINNKIELIKNKKSRNRLVFPPMDTLMAKDGFANAFHVQHYASRAYGGFGTIVVESTAVSPEGRIHIRDLGLWKNEQINSYKEVVNISKQAGAIIGIQLNHAGAKADVPNAIGVTSKYKDWFGINSTLATESDLDQIAENFIKAAKRAKTAGFDFVEIHAAHGYLFSQIIHPEVNEVIKSENITQRAKHLIYVVKKISEFIPVGIRFSIADGVDSLFETKDFEPLVKKLDGYSSYYHLSATGAIQSKELPFSSLRGKESLPFLPSSKIFRSFTKTNLICVNRYRSREDVQRGLDAGMDAIAIGRFALFNPSFVLTNILTKEEIDQRYHFNDNLWWNPFVHAKRYKN